MSTKRDNSDLIGKQINRLTIISAETDGNYIRCLVKCLCGNEKFVLKQSLLNGTTKSCGCFYKESRNFKKTVPRSDIKKNSESTFNYVYLIYKRNARIRGYPFELNKIDFRNIIIKSCFYCGDHLSQFKLFKNKKNTPGFKYTGIDRKNNKEGYTLQNSIPCCKICNRAKNDMHLDDFNNWIERLVKYVSK